MKSETEAAMHLRIDGKTACGLSLESEDVDFSIYRDLVTCHQCKRDVKTWRKDGAKLSSLAIRISN